jgi:hypothetical protein
VRRAWTIVLLAAVVAVSTAAAAPPPPRRTRAPWPRPALTLVLAGKAGLTPHTHEFFAYHVHAHLDVFVDGHAVSVPAGIGVDIGNPAVKHFDAPDGTVGYGGISPPCRISPLHTHFDDGILHTESQRTRPNLLGAFFTEWNVRLNSRCVGGYCRPKTGVRFVVNGKPFTGDPRTIPLTNLKEIAIVIGKPPAKIPARFP